MIELRCLRIRRNVRRVVESTLDQPGIEIVGFAGIWVS
jgi:hypothetical protein